MQTLSEFGDFIFGEDALPLATEYKSQKCPQLLKRADADDILFSLRGIFAVDERAQFDWIVSSDAIREVDRARNASRSQYIRDIFDHSTECLRGENIDSEVFIKKLETIGYISYQDRALLSDALASNCDTFLTIESRLPKNSFHFWGEYKILIARPETFWTYLIPHLRGL